MLEAAIRQTQILQYQVGGMVAFVEAENKEKLLSFYENYGFKCIFRKNCASVPEERSAIPLQTEQSSAG